MECNQTEFILGFRALGGSCAVFSKEVWEHHFVCQIKLYRIHMTILCMDSSLLPVSQCGYP